MSNGAPSFDLVDQPWIPCLTSNGELVEHGLRDTLVRAHELWGVVDPSPLVTAALHRLLLAVLHRVFGPRDAATWRALWESERFDAEAIEAYFGRWRQRFDLFDAKRPFYQDALLDTAYAGSVAKLVHECASGNNAVLFDHGSDDDPPPLEPALAARHLLAHQSFALGGLIKKAGETSAKAGPLANTALLLVQGANLRETLVLNMHRYNPEQGEPFAAAGPDAPAWEQDDSVVRGERHPLGYLDLLTWQCRRVRLLWDDQTLTVRRSVILTGASFPEGRKAHLQETMAAFRADPRDKESDPAISLGFREGRALWRDSLTLLRMSGKQHRQPRTLEWLADVRLPRHRTFQLQALGLASDQAHPEFWRHERLPLPVPYLDPDARYLVEALGDGVRLAEEAGALLGAGGPLFHVALDMLGDRDRARELVRGLGAEGAFWADIDVPFRDLLVRLPDDRCEQPDGTVAYGDAVLQEWAANVERAARDAFRNATEMLRASPRGLRAVAKGEEEYGRRLGALMRPYRQEQRQEVTA